MKKFKDENNQVHEIEEGFEHFLPIGAIEITQSEADTLYLQSLPTPAEIEAQKDANAIELNESKKAFAAILEILWDNSAELRATFPTKAALKQAVVDAYRAKL